MKPVISNQSSVISEQQTEDRMKSQNLKSITKTRKKSEYRIEEHQAGHKGILLTELCFVFFSSFWLLYSVYCLLSSSFLS